MLWFPGGPEISKVMPVPVHDDAPCMCQKKCCGHYRSEPTTVKTSVAAPVPSVLIKEEFTLNQALGDRAAVMAKKCLVEESTIKFYWDHLLEVQANRAKGAIKAQKTRAAKRQASKN